MIKLIIYLLFIITFILYSESKSYNINVLIGEHNLKKCRLVITQNENLSYNFFITYIPTQESMYMIVPSEVNESNQEYYNLVFDNKLQFNLIHKFHYQSTEYEAIYFRIENDKIKYIKLMNNTDYTGSITCSL